MVESFEMFPEAYRWARNVIVAFRREYNKKSGFITVAWEQEKMLALKQWAGRNAESKGVSFSWWMVDKIHNITMFSEMNTDGVATKTAAQLAEFYRGVRHPKSSTSKQFRKHLNVLWFTFRGKTLSDQYSSHIEYTIACRVVYDLMMRKIQEVSGSIIALSRPKSTAYTHADHVHEAMVRVEELHAAVTSPKLVDAPDTETSPVQLELF